MTDQREQGKARLQNNCKETRIYLCRHRGNVSCYGTLFYQTRDRSKNEEAINKACPDIHVSINYEDGVQQVLLNGENVNGLIRTEEVGNMASKTSAYKTVRATLLDLQRDLAKTANILMDGRDIGTNVLPDADLKIYLTASSKVRAERRYKELVEKGVKADFNKIEEDIIIRDRQDMEREIAPLKQADDAVLVDSSDMTIEEVVDAIVAEFEKVK